MRYRLVFLLTTLCCLLQPAISDAKPLQKMPVKVDKSAGLPLRNHQNPILQKRLNQQLISHPQWRKLIAKGKLAVGLVDLSDISSPRFAQVNGEIEMYAASLPKIAILLAAFDHFEKGKLQRTAEVEQDLHAMIRYSNNQAATRTIDRLGGLMKINAVLRDPRYHFYDRENGGLWVGKRYAKTGPRLPDPVNGLSHSASVTQVCRFYYLLATGRLVSPQASRDMLEMLSEPGIEHKFVKALHEMAPDANLYRKSGTWKQWHADSVLVWGPDWRRYILVALVESPNGEGILRELVAQAEVALQKR